ncbi:hypothetical protein [Spirosoma endophyticum]|uniref:Uncharacterized protein n=1 Tax=Spirosoma endophyticum TaxID=662367 RepID=A0A1I1VK47_9BACT|nr:hypothetical protein [Spirosoma endophyticum]SFD83239.1 hypothetical protein SAMN05216167_107220 [Spirosoma endophyticum]
MQDHIHNLLNRFQYSEQGQETAVFRVLFSYEDPSQVMSDLDIHNGYTLRNRVSVYSPGFNPAIHQR